MDADVGLLSDQRRDARGVSVACAGQHQLAGMKVNAARFFTPVFASGWAQLEMIPMDPVWCWLAAAWT